MTSMAPAFSSFSMWYCAFWREVPTLSATSAGGAGLLFLYDSGLGAR